MPDFGEKYFIRGSNRRLSFSAYIFCVLYSHIWQDQFRLNCPTAMLPFCTLLAIVQTFIISWERLFPFSIDISPCSMLLPVVWQVLEPRDYLGICDRQYFAFGVEANKILSAGIHPMTIDVGSSRNFTSCRLIFWRFACIFYMYRQHLHHLLNFFSTPLQQTFVVFTFLFSEVLSHKIYFNLEQRNQDFKSYKCKFVLQTGNPSNYQRTWRAYRRRTISPHSGIGGTPMRWVRRI